MKSGNYNSIDELYNYIWLSYQIDCENKHLGVVPKDEFIAFAKRDYADRIEALYASRMNDDTFDDYETNCRMLAEDRAFGADIIHSFEESYPNISKTYKDDDLIVCLNRAFPFSIEEYSKICERQCRRFERSRRIIQSIVELKLSLKEGPALYRKYVFKPMVMTLFGGKIVTQNLEFAMSDDAILFFSYLVEGSVYKFSTGVNRSLHNAYHPESKTSVHLAYNQIRCFKFLYEFKYVEDAFLSLHE